MKFNEIKKMARQIGVNTFQMKKNDIIMAIQKAENNIECYGTMRVKDCGEMRCLWREDCIVLDKESLD